MSYSVAYYGPSGIVAQVLTGPFPYDPIPELSGLTGASIPEARNPWDIYFNGVEITDRPVMPLVPNSLSVAVDADFIVTGLPVGVIVDYPGGVTVITDGDISWSSDEAGVFKFAFTLFPYKPEVLLVTVS